MNTYILISSDQEIPFEASSDEEALTMVVNDNLPEPISKDIEYRLCLLIASFEAQEV
jgi:hypothetical protein